MKVLVLTKASHLVPGDEIVTTTDDGQLRALVILTIERKLDPHYQVYILHVTCKDLNRPFRLFLESDVLVGRRATKGEGPA